MMTKFDPNSTTRMIVLQQMKQSERTIASKSTPRNNMVISCSNLKGGEINRTTNSVL